MVLGVNKSECKRGFKASEAKESTSYVQEKVSRIATPANYNVWRVGRRQSLVCEEEQEILTRLSKSDTVLLTELEAMGAVSTSYMRVRMSQLAICYVFTFVVLAKPEMTCAVSTSYMCQK